MYFPRSSKNMWNSIKFYLLFIFFLPGEAIQLLQILKWYQLLAHGFVVTTSLEIMCYISSFPSLNEVSYCMARAGSQGREPLSRPLSFAVPLCLQWPLQMSILSSSRPSRCSEKVCQFTPQRAFWSISAYDVLAAGETSVLKGEQSPCPPERHVLPHSVDVCKLGSSLSIVW